MKTVRFLPHQLTFMSALPHQSFRASPSALSYSAYVTIQRQTMYKLHTKPFITQVLRYKEPISIPIAYISHPGRKRTNFAGPLSMFLRCILPRRQGFGIIYYITHYKVK
ncbi:hypothetical protein CEXT_422481 [Caerostris extrusa]|uniref:Uncharacterized protein n=1 Tax=Caerostris extrusa TaxID=172846 RepID=A0AAV4NGX1_CAEEX|nr:hypothetical protein CEXT_422481 [Caerostris extrusa]